MNLPQPGIFAIGSRSHYYLELDLEAGVEPRRLVQALATFRESRATVNGVNLVVAFAPSLWRSVAPSDCPDNARDFLEPIEGPSGVLFPSSQHDAWVWAASGSYDAVFDAAREVRAATAGLARIADHVQGFGYRDSRDLSGFIDGTENPPIDEAHRVAVVPAGQPGEGSSVVLVQRWFHDLDALGALPVSDQERVFGRTKDHSIELDPLPDSAHIARVVTEDENGDEREVFRRSTSIGDVVAHGLEFVAFTNDQEIIALMLRRMAGLEDGVHDRLTDFSRAVTGSYYVAPSIDALARFAD